MPDGALHVGGVEATARVRVEDDGFREFGRKLEEVARKEAAATLRFELDPRGEREFMQRVVRADRASAEADLGFRVDDSKAKAFEAGVARADRLSATATLDVDADDRPLRRFGSSVRSARGEMRELDAQVLRTNRNFTFTRNVFSLIKWPALISGAGFAAQAFSVLTAGAVALMGALAPLSGAIAAYPALLGALGQGAGVVALAGINDLTAALGGNEEALKRLTPQGRRFHDTLKGLQPQVDSLRSAVQRPLFAGLERGLRSAMRNFPVLQRVMTETSRVMGGLAERGGRLVGSRGFGRDFERIGDRNARTLDRMGRSGIRLASAARHIMVAADPLIGWMTRSVLAGSRLVDVWARQSRESGRLAGFFRETRDVLSRLGSITQSVAAGFLQIGKAAKPLGDEILVRIDRAAQRFEDWSESMSGRNALRDYFDRARGPLFETAGLIADVGKAFLRLGTGEGVEDLIRSTRTLVPVLEDVIATTTTAFGPALIDALRNVLILVGDLAGSSGPLTLFVRTLDFMARVLHTLFETIPGTRQVTVSLLGLAGVLKALEFAKAISGFNILRRSLIAFGNTRIGRAAAVGIVEAYTGANLRVRRILGSLRTFIRNVLVGGATRGGEEAAGGLVGGFRGVGARIRRALGGVGGMLRRLFARFGIGAGEAAAEQAAGTMATTLPGRMRGSRLGGFFKRFGGTLGKLTAGGLGIALATQLDDEVDKLFGGKSPAQWLEDKLTGGPLSKEQDRTAAERRQTARQEAEARRRGVGIPPGGFSERQLRRPAQRRQEERETRVRTVEVETPILTLGGSGRAVERAMNRVQSILRRELAQARRLVERGRERIEDVFRGVRLLRGDDPLHLGSGVRRSSEDARRSLRGIVNSLGRILERLSMLARREGAEVGGQLARGLSSRGNQAIRAAERIRAGVNRQFRLMQRGSSDAARDMVASLRATFGRLDNVVQAPTVKMLQIVGRALRSLGASSRSIGRISATVERIEGRAFGGTVPGYSRVDDHIVAVRGGEEVHRPEDHVPWVNRAMAIANVVAPDLVPFGSTREMFRKTGAAYAAGGQVTKPAGYRTGGMVRVPGDPSRTGGRDLVNPAIADQVGAWARRYGASIDYAYDPGHHQSPGHEVTGTATDVSPLGGWAGRALAKFEQGLRALVAAGKKVLYGTDGIGSPYPNHGRGNHAHIEWGGGGGARQPGGALPDEPAPRVRARVRGPAGVLRDMAAGALSRVQGAANKRLSGADAVGGIRDPGGSGETLMRAIAKDRGWSFADWWEVDRRESSHGRNLVNPDSTARLRGQFLDMNYGKYGPGSDPAKNPSMREQILSMARYIAARYKNPTRARAFHDAEGWYARGGIVRAGSGIVRALGGAVRRFRNGGFVIPGQAFLYPGAPRRAFTLSPKGITRTERGGAPRGRRARVSPNRGRAPKRVGSVTPTPGWPQGLYDEFVRLTDPTGEIETLNEDYLETVEDFDRVVEEFFIEDPSGTGQQVIDWDAVRIRRAEIEALVPKKEAIVQNLRAAIAKGEELLAQIKVELERKIAAVSAIVAQVAANVRRIAILRTHLGAEKAKRRKNRRQDVINSLESQIKGFENQNEFYIGGGEGGRVGERQRLQDDIDIWEGNRGTILSTLIDLRGLTHRGGRLDEHQDDLAALVRDYADVGGEALGVKLSELNRGREGEGGPSLTEQAQSFLGAVAAVHREFGSNIRFAGSFGGGGTVPGALGQPAWAIVHGGEEIHDPSNGGRVNVKDLVREVAREMGKRNVHLHQHYEREPPQPSNYVRLALLDLQHMS